MLGLAPTLIWCEPKSLLWCGFNTISLISFQTFLCFKNENPIKIRIVNFLITCAFSLFKFILSLILVELLLVQPVLERLKPQKTWRKHWQNSVLYSIALKAWTLKLWDDFSGKDKCNSIKIHFRKVTIYLLTSCDTEERIA